MSCGLPLMLQMMWFVGVVPMINLSHSLAILLYVLCASGGRVLWLSRVTFDVLFVVVCECGPNDNIGHKLSYEDMWAIPVGYL